MKVGEFGTPGIEKPVPPRQKGCERDVLPPLGLLDALQGRPQPGLEPERQGECVGQRKGLARFTAGLVPWGYRQAGRSWDTRIGRAGLFRLGSILACRLGSRLPGREGLLGQVTVGRRKDPLVKPFRAAAPLVVAPPCCTQQHEAEEPPPDSEPPGGSRAGQQGQILMTSEATWFTFRADSRG